MTDLYFQDIAKYYGNVPALRSTNLHIRSGELFSLLGPSGCGKTTLLRIVAGFVTPTAGRLKMDADDVTELPPHKRNVGMVFQDYALFPDRSVFENVRFGLKARSLPREEQNDRAMDILRKMGLAQLADRAPGQLSGGQRQRVAMARALVISPRLLLLDEPLSALDAKLRIELREVIRSTQRDFGITTIFVTHDQEEALSVSDRIALMQTGSIVQMDDPPKLYDLPQTVFAADFLGGANLIEVQNVRQSANGRASFELANTTHEAEYADSGEIITNHATLWKLCIRPESWSPEKNSAGSLSMSGIVRSSEFLGSHVSYLIEFAHGDTVKSLARRSKGSQPLAAGEKVYLTIPKDARLLRSEVE